MKHHTSRKLLHALILTLLLVMSPVVSHAQENAPASTPAMVSPVVSYQGRVILDGQPYDGVGYFKFAIVDGAGIVTWSNDMPIADQSGNQSEPPGAVALVVTKGLFNVLLGDPLLDMPSLVAPVFYDPASTLRVWFSDSMAGPFTQLPDRALASTPYAFLADEAGTLNGFTASDFALTGHTHWGEAWSGSGTGVGLSSSDGWGLDVSTGSSSEYATAIRGTVDASSGKSIAVWGANESGSDGAMGVWGQVGGPGQTYGVFGQNSSGHLDSAGVFGHAQASSGLTSGVVGRSDSHQGIGVQGVGHASSGARPSIAVGVWGDTDTGIAILGYTGSSQNDMAGVAGSASSTTGKVHGVSGQTRSSEGYGVLGDNTGGGSGVYGKSSATSGDGAGVVGESDSLNGAGVAGYAYHESGENYGVWGTTQSDHGYGLYGTAPTTGVMAVATGSGTTYGVYGKSTSLSGRGVYGEGGYYGLYGLGTDPSGISHGIYGETRSTAHSASGVYGKASQPTGVTYGVYGESSSPDGYAVYANGNAHVQGKLTWQAKSSFISIPPPEFFPNPSNQYRTGVYLECFGGCGGSYPFFAPIQLPHNAQVTSLTIHWQDTRHSEDVHGLQDATVTLYRSPVASGGVFQEMAQVTTWGSTGQVLGSTDTTISNAVINNGGYFYYLWVVMPQSETDPLDPVENPQLVRLYGAVIGYEITEPY